jgi:hypothetical protein
VLEHPEQEGVAVAWVLLSLVYLHQGQTEEAKPWLKRVDEWLAERWKAFPPATPLAPAVWDWNGNLEVRRLRDEAEALRTKPTP